MAINRRHALLPLLILCLVAADWPQFLGPNRNGVSSETGLARSWPATGPKVLWQKEVGAGFSGPVIMGDRVILFHRQDNQEIVECLNAGAGERQWKFAYPTTYHDDFGFDEGPRSTPLIADNQVYTLGAEGVLTCLELATGAKVWQRSLNADYQVRKGFFGVATSPLLEGDKLLVNIGGKSQGAGIVALDPATGKELWHATDHEASYSSPVAATIDGVRHVFFFTREGILSLDPANGAVRFNKHWRARMHASVNAAAPVVIGDHLFVSACYGTGAVLLRVRKDGCDEVWKGDEIMSNHYATSVVAGDFLYGIDGRQEEKARFRCIEWRTGKVRWTQERFGCGSLILADGQLIVLTESGELVLIEATPDGYRERARAAVLSGKDCRAQIALAGGRLCGRDGSKLVCWDLRK